ncbi:hypothetical protein PQX77_014299 [Marasmius sp. AFHP31]|nr:hypothetical protein PQX77_014299 [Marasmius sp. AFHP31]
MSCQFSSEPFISFLQDIDPLSTYTIVQLSGGLVNFTVRATKTSNPDTGFFMGHKTLVIKHALPFVASIGEGAPLSPFRQVVEQRALDILKATPFAQNSSQVAVPSVLHHDDQRHMLVITDLGDNLITIDKWLENNPGKDQLADVARRLGTFLAALHTLEIPEETFQALDNPDIIEAIERDVVDRVNGIIDTLCTDDESRDLGKMLKDEYRKSPRQWVFSVGDLWIGSILVSPLGETVAIVDWENAGRGKPLQDMGQFASHFNSPSVGEGAGIFIRGLFDWYRREALSAKAMWMELSPYRDEAIESAWILQGREIVYRAGELSDNSKRQELAECGFKYLRAAKRRLCEVDVLEETFLRPLYSLRD